MNCSYCWVAPSSYYTSLPKSNLILVLCMACLISAPEELGERARKHAREKVSKRPSARRKT